ncbi:MAG TPA: hypothetical protein VKK79_08890 [Candidatus Lokiarchaeia archaeon]|nr:hypothetical protein [Candidatus Lokiarchaeia archaeon]
MITVFIDEEKVREIASQLSQEPKSWDDFVWLFAEAELRLLPAYAGGARYQQGADSRAIDLDPDLLVDQPAEDDIRKLAEEIARSHPSLQDLHWYLAERRYIFGVSKAPE